MAQKILGSIKTKMRKNRLTLSLTLAALLLVVCFIIYTYVY